MFLGPIWSNENSAILRLCVRFRVKINWPDPNLPGPVAAPSTSPGWSRAGSVTGRWSAGAVGTGWEAGSVRQATMTGTMTTGGRVARGTTIASTGWVGGMGRRMSGLITIRRVDSRDVIYQKKKKTTNLVRTEFVNIVYLFIYLSLSIYLWKYMHIISWKFNIFPGYYMTPFVGTLV